MFTKNLQCSDCCSKYVNWASLNRGALLCDECCSIHLNLGRHISEIKMLKGENWRGKQSDLMEYLYKTSANLVFCKNAGNQTESKTKQKGHLYKDSQSEMCSTTKIDDTADCVRETNILTKYSCINSTKDSRSENFEVNMQLLACVRTSHVEITLRLLVLGGNALFTEKDTGNSCMHIAAREGQELQIELLFLFGADPAAENRKGITPYGLAVSHNHSTLAQRLLDMKNHVVREIASFVIEHKQSIKQQDMSKFYIANQSLRHTKQLSLDVKNCNERQFVKIIQDLYDEVERRKILSDFQKIENGKFFIEEKKAAAFLPSIASYSPTHNQYRQKMAKLSSAQFILLIMQVLKEYEKRTPRRAVKKSTESLKESNVRCSELREIDGRQSSSDIQEKPIVSIYQDGRSTIPCNVLEKPLVNSSSMIKSLEDVSIENNKIQKFTQFTHSSRADSFIDATEKLTSDIRNLVKATQTDIGTELAELYANKIGESVLELIKCIPSRGRSEELTELTELLWENVALLSCKCNSPILRKDDVCAAAYELAQTTKNLLSLINR